MQLPWTDDYRRYCLDFESKSRVFGGFWTGNAAERQFGPASARRDFTGHGDPRWKQRALYDGVPLGNLLKPGKIVAPQQLEKLMARRTIPTGTAEHPLPHPAMSLM